MSRYQEENMGTSGGNMEPWDKESRFPVGKRKVKLNSKRETRELSFLDKLAWGFRQI